MSALAVPDSSDPGATAATPLAVGPVQRYVAEFKRLRDSLCGNEHPGLRDLRQQALDRFAELGLPRFRQEAWKYTDIDALAKADFSIVDTQPSMAQQTDFDREPPLPNAAVDTILMVDGYCVALPGSVAPGLELSNLRALAAAELDTLQRTLEKALDDDAFNCLNLALFTDGVRIRVKEGTHIERPLVIRCVATRPMVQQLRIVVEMEADARLVMVESYEGPNGVEYFTNVVTHVGLQNRAVLEHCRMQRESTAAFHIADLRTDVSAEARYSTHLYALGGLLARNGVTVQLAGQQAQTTIAGLYLGKARQHHDQQIQVDHQQPGTTSTQFFHGILDDRSRGVFRGGVRVQPNAQKVDARQLNRNLLLTEHAEADTQPQLQIYADDVKCSHGATVGQLDDDALFYLQSRGLSPALAQNLLTVAFAREALAHVDSDVLRMGMDSLLNDYLHPDKVSP